MSVTIQEFNPDGTPVKTPDVAPVPIKAEPPKVVTMPPTVPVGTPTPLEERKKQVNPDVEVVDPMDAPTVLPLNRITISIQGSEKYIREILSKLGG